MSLRVPGYEVGELAGRGSRGEVWSATAKASGAPVALKRLPVDSRWARDAAHGEAEMLRTLAHPGLIGLYDVLEFPTHIVLVLELADGGSMSDLLRRRGRLAPEEAAAALSQVGAALAHAHDQGVLHGDVSAANILFDAAGRPKLADLGVARLFGSDSNALGTPAYLDSAVAAGQPSTTASDVFSLAAVTLHAAGGSPPWGALDTDVDEMLARAAAADIIDVRAALEHCPPALTDVVARGLNRSPQLRGTAREFALDLRASVVPQRVVLRAGRLDTAAPLPLGTPAPESAAGGSRPDFRRSLTMPEWPATTEVTQLSRPPVRPIIGRPPRRFRPVATTIDRLRGMSGRTVAIGAVAVAVTLAVIGLGRWLHGPQHPAISAGPGPRVETATSAPYPVAPNVVDPTVPVGLILAQLDADRSDAYARRAAAALAPIYSSATLLRQDQAQLLQATPSQCGLFGLHTTYTRLVVLNRTTTAIELTARATTTAAELRCGSTVRARSLPASDVGLQITLSGSTADGYRIASQRTLAGAGK